MDSWNNGGVGSTNMTSSWGVCDAYSGSTGPEYAYDWYAPATGSVTLTLTGLADQDRDLFVFADTGSGCSVGSMTCIGSSQNGCTVDFFGGVVCDDDVVTFTATAGTHYFFVVDGYGGAVGPYTLQLTGCSF
jgi:hypothetical protein